MADQTNSKAIFLQIVRRHYCGEKGMGLLGRTIGMFSEWLIFLINLFTKRPSSLQFCLAIRKLTLGNNIFIQHPYNTPWHIREVNMAVWWHPNSAFSAALSIPSGETEGPARWYQAASSAWILTSWGQRLCFLSLNLPYHPTATVCTQVMIIKCLCSQSFLAQQGECSMGEFQEACDSRKLVKWAKMMIMNNQKEWRELTEAIDKESNTWREWQMLRREK